ncbi:uracil-DNA glycosylase [Helicobacter sp. MIT 14-3879]|uniref:uracil-DNA glycosylase n=1 Tax=Helicobacter sp. MIT 14-3879 TaxID=2040649 RepID=UPI000E1F6891|nr:uracil-DNA glycosylase [Helicobacter sp. MIT 14-3879]RDU61742.1 uracil-DNA glycosylase [Helicobacter sp. MIT 14-3879]
MYPKTLHKDWCEFLKDEFNKPYFKNIIQSYKHAQHSNQTIFPPRELIFNAFNLTPLHSIRVVILGQDPYHGSFRFCDKEIPQAMGLSFSVPRPVPIPPSLKNIYEEITQSLGIIMPNHGDLSVWASRGILLLNAILTVEKGKAGSHKDFGWEYFSDSVIARISDKLEGVVFMLWGNFAKKKIGLINCTKHIVITAPHPSPLTQGFVGSGIFKRANEELLKRGKEPIDWSLPLM